MLRFASGNPLFNDVIQTMVRKADDVDFFDKLLRDRVLTILKNEKAEKEAFSNTMKNVGKQIDGILNIPINWNDPLQNQTIVDAANYSLESGGKRVRPLMAWAMGVSGYGLDPKAMAPLLRSLEYMHTASLIFDDLPSQDNADTRRGCPTLHAAYNFAIAELTGLFLTQKAVEEQASLDQFDPKTVLNLIRYAAGVTEDMCKGQAMDLDSKGKPLTLEQLNTMCFYKTGLAFQASFVMPAILAHVKEPEIEALKNSLFMPALLSRSRMTYSILKEILPCSENEPVKTLKTFNLCDDPRPGRRQKRDVEPLLSGHGITERGPTQYCFS
jgi:hypothetical protein